MAFQFRDLEKSRVVILYIVDVLVYRVKSNVLPKGFTVVKDFDLEDGPECVGNLCVAPHRI